MESRPPALAHGSERARRDGWELEPASLSVRVLYLLALAQLLFPIGLMAMATFPSMLKAVASGASFVMMISVGLPAVLTTIAIVWRAMEVLRGRSRLAAPPALGALHWLRQTSLLLMLIGVAATLLTWFTVPLVRSLVPGGTERGAVFFVAAMWLGGFTLWASAGLALFEFGRLVGLERAAQEA